MSEMNRAVRYVVAVLVVILTGLVVLTSAHAATTAPKVVFIGDWVTYGWTSAFAANPNWVNQGTPGVGVFGSGDSGATLARFQADVVALHPAIVHIMIGSSDADEAHDANWRLYSQVFLTSLTAMVTEAKAANIQVVLGLEPGNFSYGAPDVLQQLNSLVANYGAMNNIPVINYGDALCGCVGSTGGTGIGSSFSNAGAPYIVPDFITTVDGQQIPGPSAAGYALMTQMAGATINTLNAKLSGGYLQDIEQSNDNEDSGPTRNVNTVFPGAVVQFTPYGYYSNGLLEPFINSNFAGSSGTWASSNPLVMYVSQKGLAWALSPGTAIITYTSPTGVHFSEWIMYINAGS